MNNNQIIKIQTYNSWKHPNIVKIIGSILILTRNLINKIKDKVTGLISETDGSKRKEIIDGLKDNGVQFFLEELQGAQKETDSEWVSKLIERKEAVDLGVELREELKSLKKRKISCKDKL